MVTSRGKAIACIVPFKEDRAAATRARASLLSRLRSERVVKIGHWERDELYD